MGKWHAANQAGLYEEGFDGDWSGWVVWQTARGTWRGGRVALAASDGWLAVETKSGPVWVRNELTAR